MFAKGTYKLVDKQGFIDSNIGNLNLANEIESTGGIIIVTRVTDGAAMGVTYGDNSHNEWACIWPNEVRFFSRGDGEPVASQVNPLDHFGALVSCEIISFPKDDYPTLDIKFKPHPTISEVHMPRLVRDRIVDREMTNEQRIERTKANLKLNPMAPTCRQARRLQRAA